jgi:hypothetical protein
MTLSSGLIVEPAEVLDRQLPARGRADRLVRHPVDLEERGPQRLVPADHQLDRAAERVDVEGTPQAVVERVVVGGSGGIQLVQEPEALLGVRQRRLVTAPRGDEGRQLGAVVLPAQPHHLGRHPGHGRLLEQQAQRQVDAQGLAHPRHRQRGQDRVSTELEEVVADADPLGAEDLGPDAGEHLLLR